MERLLILGLAVALSACDQGKPVETGGEPAESPIPDSGGTSTSPPPAPAAPGSCRDGGPVRPTYLDRDHDGYGDPATSLIGCPHGRRIGAGGDCDDADPLRNPGRAEDCDGDDDDCDGQIDDGATVTCYDDDDGDGYGDVADHQTRCWVCDEGTTRRAGDCDDSTADLNPGQPELCDGIDDDCDGDVDEGTPTGVTLYRDADRDGFGNPRFPSTTCTAPYAWVTDNTDCDDHDEDTWPGAFDGCDEEDNDCDGETDEDGIPLVCYDDDDDDGYGDPDSPHETCSSRCDIYKSELSGDCDDRDEARSPAATETCDAEDNDCDGEIDEGFGDGTVWYADGDGDGFGDAATPSTGCDTGHAWVLDATDCDDDDDDAFPGAVETCDRTDEDCDGEVDEGLPTSTWYSDDDEDGYGDPDAPVVACRNFYAAVDSATDCQDRDPDAHPGAVEDCGDGEDDDCDGLLDCEDDGCDGASVCAERACADGLDDDGDGDADCDDDECWGTADCATTGVARVRTADYAKRSHRAARDRTHDTCGSVSWTRSEVTSCDRVSASAVRGSARVYAPGEAVRVCDWGVEQADVWTCRHKARSDSWSSSSVTSGATREGFWIRGSCGFDDSGFLPPLAALTDTWFTWYGALHTVDSAPFFDDDPSTGCDERFSGHAHTWTYATAFAPGRATVFTISSGAAPP